MGGEEEGDQAEEQDREEHGHEHRELRGVPLAGVEQHGRDRARSGEQRDGEQRDGEGEDRDVVLVGDLLLLAHGAGAQAGGAREDHVEREQEEQYPARYPERRDADTQGLQQRVASDREEQEYGRAYDGAPDRYLPLALLRIAPRQGREDRGEPRGSTTTSSVTNELKTNSSIVELYPVSGTVRHSPRNERAFSRASSSSPLLAPP